jgi:hypothetical protein
MNDVLVKQAMMNHRINLMNNTVPKLSKKEKDRIHSRNYRERLKADREKQRLVESMS